MFRRVVIKGKFLNFTNLYIPLELLLVVKKKRFYDWDVPDGQVPIHRDPHEGVDGYRPESNLQIANETTHDVPVDPFSCVRWIHRERNHQQTTKKVRRRERQQVVVYHLGGTYAV